MFTTLLPDVATSNRSISTYVIKYVLASWLVGCHEKSAHLSFPIFHCFYLAQNPLSTKKSRTRRRPARSRHVEIDLAGLRRVGDFFGLWTCLRHVWNLLKTCRRPGRKPGFKQVLSKRDLMDFGHNQPRMINSDGADKMYLDSKLSCYGWYVTCYLF